MLKRKVSFILIALVLALTSLSAGCGLQGEKSQQDSQGKENEPKKLVIYSGRKEQLIKPVLDQFEKKTGIEVILRSGGASELANAILEEKNNPQADVYIANDAGALEKLRMEGALQPNGSKAVNALPSAFRADDGSWTGVSVRGRVIMYNTQLVQEKDVPTSVFELTAPRWKGQVAMAQSSNESTIAHVTAIRKIKDEAAAENFLRGLLANKVNILKGHTEVRNAVGSGEFKLGLVNHYYYHLQKNEGSPVGIVYPDQGPDQMGTVINISGAGLIKGAKNTEAAKTFIDFLLTPEAQKIFAELNYEIPVLEGIPVKEAKSLESFKRAEIELKFYGSEMDNTVRLLEKAAMP